MIELYKNHILSIIISLIFFVGFWSYSAALYIMGLSVIFFVIQKTYFKNKYFELKEITFIDFCVLAVLVVEMLSYFTSLYKPNSQISLQKAAVICLFYFFIRATIHYSIQKKIVVIAVAGYGFLLSFLTIISFLLFQFNISYEGFTNVIEFRNLYMPLGVYSNEWVTILLGFLPFQICAMIDFGRVLPKLIGATGIILTVISIIVSFSRGAYMALVLFAILSFSLLAWFRVNKAKVLLRNYVLIGFSSLILVLPFHNEILSTCKMVSTSSHQRSLEGRTTTWSNSLQLVKQNPITGIGANNFTLKYATINKNEESPFNGRIANSFLQLLIEKGILGVIGYMVLCFAFVKISLREIRNSSSETVSVLFFLSAMVAILFREMSFSSIFEDNGLLILLFVIIVMNTTHVDSIKSN